jgi:hypothetical protein
MKPLPCPYCGKTVRAWRVQLIDGAFWTCRCERDTETEPMCQVPFPKAADTEEQAVSAWNAIVLEERARIDALVGYVSPLDYAWAKRRGRRKEARHA